jgi:hypothetical protein
MLYGLAVFAFACGVLFVFLGGYVMAVILACEAVLLVNCVTLRRAAFRDGWLQGRAAMFQSLAEAQRRGLSPGEWIIGECERDGYRVEWADAPALCSHCHLPINEGDAVTWITSPDAAPFPLHEKCANELRNR